MNTKPRRSSASANLADPDAERAVLGAILLDRNALFEVVDVLTREAFSCPEHRHVWDATQRLVAADRPVDVVTVTDDLERAGVLTGIGGRGTLVDIADSVFTAALIGPHARIVADHRRRRQLQELCQETLDSLQDDPDQILSRLENRLIGIGESETTQLRTIDQQITRMVEFDQEVLAGHLLGYNWPLVDLSRITRGIRPGKFHLIIGLFKSGKSKLLTATIRQLIEESIPVLFLSLEMGPTQVLHWLAGNALSIDTSLFGSPRISRRQTEDAHRWVMQTVGQGRLIIDSRGAQTPETICAAIRRAVACQKVKVVCLDYLQRVVWAERQQSATDIARGPNLIASTAKRLDVAVIAISQVPKSAENQPSGRLISLGDVKDAGAYAEVADVSIAITDPNRHKPSATPRRPLHLLIEQRDGRSARIDVLADLRYGHFHSVIKGECDPVEDPVAADNSVAAEAA